MTHQAGHNEPGGLPLDQYTKSQPPGWQEGLPHYPFRLYSQKMKLWLQLTDLSESQVGPAIAGRLKGRLFNLAMSLRIQLPDGSVLTEDAALSHAGTPADPNNLFPATRSGMQELMHLLRDRFGALPQYLHVGSIDAFEAHRRGNMTLLEYLNEFAYLLDQAIQLSNYNINDVAKTHRLLKFSGVPADQLEFLKIMTNHDLSQYDFFVTRLTAMAKASTTTGQNQLPGRHGYYGEEDNDWDDDGWNSHGWYYGDLDDDAWYDHDYEDEWDDWQEDSGTWHTSDWAGQEAQSSAYGHDDSAITAGSSSEATADASAEQSWQEDEWLDDFAGKAFGKRTKGKGKGKGKGKRKGFGKPKGGGRSSGKGCTQCGSPNHNSPDCPWSGKGGKGHGGGKKGGRSRQRKRQERRMLHLRRTSLCP